jgi:C4-dicarboxylate transporter
MTPIQKAVCVGALLAVWLYLVVTGQAPAGEFVTTLKEIALAMGAVHVALADPKGPGSQ